MIKRGYSFEFEVPDDWQQFKNKSQLFLHGPEDVEIIVSGWTVRGEGLDSEFLTIREQLLQNAFESVNLVTSDPAVIVTAPLKHHKIAPGFDRWDVTAHTKDSKVLFAASIFRSIVGVLLITFEAPNRKNIRDAYDKIIQSFRRVEAHQDLDEFSV